MHLNTFFWEGVHRFHQTLKRVHGTKMVKHLLFRLRKETIKTVSKYEWPYRRQIWAYRNRFYASGIGLLGSRLQRCDIILRTLRVRTQHITQLCPTLPFYFIRSWKVVEFFADNRQVLFTAQSVLSDKWICRLG